jgi:hypothetical protein
VHGSAKAYRILAGGLVTTPARREAAVAVVARRSRWTAAGFSRGYGHARGARREGTGAQWVRVSVRLVADWMQSHDAGQVCAEKSTERGPRE